MAVGDTAVVVIPTEIVDLPSKGRFYPSDHPLYNKEYVEIKHMTAKEEDILTSANLIRQGKVIDTLINASKLKTMAVIDPQRSPGGLDVYEMPKKGHT